MNLCDWCRRVELVDPRARFCSRLCRQAAWRLRRQNQVTTAAAVAGVFAYADPPYPGLAARYYRDEPTYAGEVDHPALIASLRASGYTGWALSTSAAALRDLLPLCPPHARVCAWVKPHGVPRTTRGIHSTWEPVIVVGGRQRQPGVRDWLRAMPARLGGETLPGRKPLAFCAWLFDLLGMQPGDTFVDLFPGTGIVTRAWGELSFAAASDTGRRPRPSATHPSPGAPDDTRGARRFLSVVQADGATDASLSAANDRGAR